MNNMDKNYTGQRNEANKQKCRDYEFKNNQPQRLLNNIAVYAFVCPFARRFF